MKKIGPAWTPAVAAVLCVSCVDVLGLGKLPTSCSGGGGARHAGSIDGQTRWRAPSGPHRVTATVNVSGELIIDPGTLVCVARDARIEVLAKATLTARSGPESPITFAASNRGERWGGILIRSESKATLTHTRLEHAKVGIEVESAGRVELERSVLRQIEGPALATDWAAYASLVETAIDSACSSNCGAAISSSGYLKFQDSRILASGAVGIYGSPYSDIDIDGGSIEGSKGIGLVKSNYPSGSRTLGRKITAARPIRITGGASYPARLPIQFAAAMLATREAQDGWRGNARDTVLALSEWYGLAPKLTIYPGLAWKTSQGEPYVTVRLLELEPGAVWIFSGRMDVEHLVSRGTAETPTTITGVAGSRVTLTGAPSEPSRFSHARLTRTHIEVGANHPVVLEDVFSENGYLRLDAPGSRLTRAAFLGSADWFPAPSVPALHIRTRDVTLSQCVVTRSSGAGVLVDATASEVRINDCNLHENAGPALDNRAAEPVDARNNWWGDPAGPNGPNGNRVAGNVLFEPYRTEPVQTGAVQANRLPQVRSRHVDSGAAGPRRRSSGQPFTASAIAAAIRRAGARPAEPADPATTGHACSAARTLST